MGTKLLRSVVTGAAGFIGSHLVEEQLNRGLAVTGIDCFDPWYSPEVKRANLSKVLNHPNFDLIEADLNELNLVELLDPDCVVFHLAARAGVQDSWGEGFESSIKNNVLATQKLMEASLKNKVNRFLYASSSSVYGNADIAQQQRIESPISPYGVTKLAVDQLGRVYGARGLQTVGMRYFTVYGPRQRPDMAMNRLFQAALPGDFHFSLRGDGTQKREFTYVSDVVDATLALSQCSVPAGSTFDIGGGSSCSVLGVISDIERLVGSPCRITEVSSAPGDPKSTEATLGPISKATGWKPKVSLEDGLSEQYLWQERQLSLSR
jgi:nucleoside-diphosphate-sugar epimerase